MHCRSTENPIANWRRASGRGPVWPARSSRRRPPHATEILGLLGFDFVVFDMEHAAIDLGSLDRMVLGARAANVAAVVRVPEGSPSAILSALDLGATGILVPHVSSRAIAQTIVASCRYKDGKRGFANTTRAGNYGLTGFEAHKASQDHETACIAMIEDLEAVAVIDDILSVPGLDAVIIGRGDLTAALGYKAMNDPRQWKSCVPSWRRRNATSCR